MICFFFFKQKTAYEMRISDWSSDVCSSDLGRLSRPMSLTGRTALSAARAGSQAMPYAWHDSANHERTSSARSPHLRHLRTSLVGTPCSNRSEERRVGKEVVSKGNTRWAPHN